MWTDKKLRRAPTSPLWLNVPMTWYFYKPDALTDTQSSVSINDGKLQWEKPCSTYISIITAQTATQQASNTQRWWRRLWWYNSNTTSPRMLLRTRCLHKHINNSKPTTGKQHTDVSNTKPRSTWFIVLRQPRTSPVDSDYALPVVTNFLCRVIDSAHLVVGPSLSLDQWLGMRCRLTSVIRRVVTSLSDVHWKHSCSLSTSVYSELEVFLRRCAI